MTTRSTVLICLIVALIPFAAAAKEDKTHDLEVTAKKGDSVRFRQTTTSDAKVAAMEYERGDSFIREYTVTVKEVRKDGARVVAVEFGRIHGKMNLPRGMGFEFDSEKPDEFPEDPRLAVYAKALTAFATKTVTVTLDGTAKVLAVEGMKSLVRDAAGEQMPEMSDEEAIREVQGLFAKLPSDAQPIGGTWKSTETLVLVGKNMKWDFTHTLASFGEKEFEVTAKLAPAPLEKESTSKREGSGTGTTTFSAKDGFLVKSTAQFKLTTITRVEAISTWKSTIERLPAEKPAEKKPE